MKYDPEERLTFIQIEEIMKNLNARAPSSSPSTSSPPPSPQLGNKSDDESDHRCMTNLLRRLSALKFDTPGMC